MKIIIDTLTEFYAAASYNPFVMTLVFWLFWPGLMFAVGWIGESRLVPIGASQSIAFWPGDFALGVMVVALIGVHSHVEADSWGYSTYWWTIVVAVMLIVAWRLRAGDVINYPPRAGVSPTKITHDVVGYFLIPTTLVGLGVPQLFALPRAGIKETRYCWLMFVAGVVFYLACVAMDAVCSYSDADIAARHPADWAPIWQTKK